MAKWLYSRYHNGNPNWDLALDDTKRTWRYEAERLFIALVVYWGLNPHHKKFDRKFMDGARRGVRGCLVGRKQRWGDVKQELHIK